MPTREQVEIRKLRGAVEALVVRMLEDDVRGRLVKLPEDGPRQTSDLADIVVSLARLHMMSNAEVEALGASLRRRVEDAPSLTDDVIKYLEKMELNYSREFTSRRERREQFRLALINGELSFGDVRIVDHRCPLCQEQVFNPSQWSFRPRLKRGLPPCCRRCTRGLRQPPRDLTCPSCGKRKKQRRQWALADGEDVDGMIVCRWCHDNRLKETR